MFTPDFEAGPERGNVGPWLARNHGFPALPLRSGSSGLPEYRLRLPHWVTRMNLIWFCLALVFCVDFHLHFTHLSSHRSVTSHYWALVLTLNQGSQNWAPPGNSKSHMSSAVRLFRSSKHILNGTSNLQSCSGIFWN